MIDNLLRLKKLDPKTYDAILLAIDESPDEWTPAQWAELLQISRSQDRIQGCLQRAIAAKIDPAAEKVNDTAGHRIEQGRDGCDAYVWWDWRKTYYGHGDNPAAALLAAYLEACQ